MTAPPPYPRTPYLWRDDGVKTNLVPSAERAGWLTRPVVVEEKLDGANVSLWWESGAVRVASRGGEDARDRAGQLGRLRGWAAEHHLALATLLANGRAAYGEWLWLTHTVEYDRLPDWLVVLDLWTPDAGMLPLEIRDQAVADAGLVVPPGLVEGVVGTRHALIALMGTSRFGNQPMEGVVLRRPDGARCKVVRPGFDRKRNAEWIGQPTHNRLRLLGRPHAPSP